MLTVDNVTKKYGGFTALEGVSLTFSEGVYGLLAPNGAGKTTLIKMLTTLLFPTSGQILWDGTEIGALGARIVPPTLEDVFLYVYQDEEGGNAAVSF